MVILATVLPLIPYEAWWIRVFDFPRVQITLVTLFVLIVQFVFTGMDEIKNIIFTMALIACIIYQVYKIRPYTRFHALQVNNAVNPSPENIISLLTANVLMSNRHSQKLIQIIRAKNPDLILLVETDKRWEDEVDILRDDYPYSVKYPLDNRYGMHLYSRLELIDPQVAFLVEDDIPSIHTEVVLPSGHRVEMHCVHPEPPSPTEKATSAERDAELLLVAKSVDSGERSVIVTGDLNDVAWSRTTMLFQKLSGLLDPRIGRGMFNTFHAEYPPLRWPLDHIFLSNDFTLIALERQPYFGSDHFPVYASFCHTPNARTEQEKPQADNEDIETANHMIDKVSVDDKALS